jgi:sugar O-acyltransferase (sialic acid O-acetyltransferase NeuD family)
MADHKPAILLIGAGGHSHACIDAIERGNQYSIFGLVCADGEDRADRLGYPVVGTDADLPALSERCGLALVAAGQIRSPALRMRLYQRVLALGMACPAIVSSQAYVSPHARIGAGTLVMHGAIVNAGASIGANCIINSRSLVEHDVQVGDHCHIATGAILNGGVQVGDGSFIGSGSVVREGLRIGRDCLVGMAQAVRHTLPDGAQQPARITPPCA